jgi:Family of unknown function (DUF6404)
MQRSGAAHLRTPPRVTAAIEILDAKGVKHCSYRPLSFENLLWRMGREQPPPQFVGFGRSFISQGLFIGPVWALLMWALVWRWEGRPFSEVPLMAAVGGTIFGLAMATYYWHIRRKHDLPAWSQIRAG